jgi:hypothetical protein
MILLPVIRVLNLLDVLIEYSITNEMSLWRSMNTEPITEISEESQDIIDSFNEVIHSSSELDEEARIRHIITEIPSLNHLLEFRIDDLLPLHECDEETSQDDDIEGIRFLTIHSSKGLDADYVFIPFMEQSIELTGRNLDEKRRLLYVALTRAKVGVIFSWAWSRHTRVRYSCFGSGGGFKDRRPSTFISECGVFPTLKFLPVYKSSIDYAFKILSDSALRVKEYGRRKEKEGYEMGFDFSSPTAPPQRPPPPP